MKKSSPMSLAQAKRLAEWLYSRPDSMSRAIIRFKTPLTFAGRTFDTLCSMQNPPVAAERSRTWAWEAFYLAVLRENDSEFRKWLDATMAPTSKPAPALKAIWAKKGRKKA